MEILELTKSFEWRWVPSKQNVADDATKWIGAPDFSDTSRWFSGPQFLKENADDWPVEKDSQTIEEDQEELRQVLHVRLKTANHQIIDPERFSQWRLDIISSRSNCSRRIHGSRKSLDKASTE